MKDAESCPGCPECRPARPTKSVPRHGSKLTRAVFGDLLDEAYARYLKLPEPDRASYDAASYVAGLEHGYSARPQSDTAIASLIVLCFLAIGIIVGIAFP